MTTLKIGMIKQAQLLNDVNSSAHTIINILAEDAGVTPSVLLEDVTNVLTNFATNIHDGKGLLAMGGNVNNYSFFLAGLESILSKLRDTQHPQAPQVVTNVLKRLSGINIVGGLITPSSQGIVDFGARAENQPIAQKYEGMVKNLQKDPAAILNAIGQLKLAAEKLKMTQPAAGTPTAMKTQPVTKTPNTLPPSGPSMAGAAPAGGSAGIA